MKNILKIYLAAMFFFLGSQSANAGLFGWEATIVAIDPATSTYHDDTAHGATPFACEANRTAIIDNFSMTLGYTIVSQPPCVPQFFKLPNLDRFNLIKWNPKWPPGPWCLSCPYLDDLTIKRIYPDHIDRVQSLKEIYQIDVYNKALLALQSKFDLEGFEKSMAALESKQLR